MVDLHSRSLRVVSRCPRLEMLMHGTATKVRENAEILGITTLY